MVTNILCLCFFLSAFSAAKEQNNFFTERFKRAGGTAVAGGKLLMKIIFFG
jgi:hypothetical protein